MSASPGRTRTTKQSASSVQKAAVAIACRTCRSKKVKCSGTVPCQYCSKRALPCSISPRGPRRVYSVKSKIAELENRLERYEEHGGSVGSLKAPPGPSGFVDLPDRALPGKSPIAQSQNDQPVTPGNPILTQSTTTSDPVNSRLISSSTPRPYASAAIEAESSLSSSNRFGRKVQEVLTKSGSTRSSDLVTITPSPQQSGNLDQSLRNTTKNPPQLPSEDEAFRLLEAVSLFIGQSQSHYDSREISDQVGLLYENINDPAQCQELWYLEVILILAIGKLFAANFQEGGRDLLGEDLFDFAQQNFPTTIVQYANGRLGVELNALMATYLQMMDRKEEAYLYINGALRLAVVHGYHQENIGRKLLRSEKAQINRLWWTVYMQERRLAAATGTPSGIIDDAIDLSLPSDASGFPPAAAIRANIKIARVTGQVITSLYGTKFKNEEDFVSHAQQIIKSLLDISAEIPSEQFLNVAGTSSNLSLRTAASLYLFLYQATLLTIRPLMLHVTQSILSGNHPPSAELTGGTLGKLSKTCSEAARRILQVIINLKKRNLVAVYGFFECDAIFSAVFIMLLTKIFDSACDPDDRISPSPGLQEAMDVLHYLADRGNIFARERILEVQTVWGHLSAMLQVPELFDIHLGPQGPGVHEPEVVEANNSASQLPSTFPIGQASRNEEDMRQDLLQTHEDQPWGASIWNNVPETWFPMGFAGDGNSMSSLVADIPLEDSFRQYQSLLNDPDWALTGQDVGDFAELRRHIMAEPLVD